jgi:hypothetical protein
MNLYIVDSVSSSIQKRRESIKRYLPKSLACERFSTQALRNGKREGFNYPCFFKNGECVMRIVKGSPTWFISFRRKNIGIDLSFYFSLVNEYDYKVSLISGSHFSNRKILTKFKMKKTQSVEATSLIIRCIPNHNILKRVIICYLSAIEIFN